MASRIIACIACTLYFCLLISITIIGFGSMIVGAVGIGLYIPTSTTYDSYKNNTCAIIDVDYDSCIDSCYYVMWSVKYRVSYGKTRQYTFSTITKTYNTLNEVKKETDIYADNTNHTCYYDQSEVARVQWTRPSSPKPYLIMLIVGFSLTGIYLILIAIIFSYRIYNSKK